MVEIQEGQSIKVIEHKTLQFSEEIEAEILDIFAYNVSTKDVVSSGKTSWLATGNEKYYEVTGEK